MFVRAKLTRVVLLLAFFTPVLARADWFNPDWPYRRALDLSVDTTRLSGDETIIAEFNTAGHVQPGGADIRIVTEDGREAKSRVLSVGPGDHAMVVFNPVGSQKKYYAYFGNEKKGIASKLEPASITSGLLMEVRQAGRGPTDRVAQMEDLFKQSGETVGSALLTRPYLGFNPVCEGSTISRVTGTLYIPAEAEYSIAMSCDDRGGLRIDGKDTLFAPGFPEDARFNKTIRLARGPHKLEYFHLDVAGDLRFVIAWRRTEAQKYEPIGEEFFGKTIQSTVGKLEKLKATVVSDFDTTVLGECFANDSTSYRVRFEAREPGNKSNAQYEWDFGDGQSAKGISVDHVYLKGGIYSITLKTFAPAGTDTQKTAVMIRRDPDRITDPPIDDPAQQSRVISFYDPARMRPEHLAPAVILLARGREVAALGPMLGRMCSEKKLPDQQLAVDALSQAISAMVAGHREKELVDAVSQLSPDSNLQPKAADQVAALLLWRTSDFHTAVTMLKPFESKDSRNLHRLYAMALLLDGKSAEAQKMFQSMADPSPQKRALSGALARSVEYFISIKDTESAEEKWDEWMRKYPEDFLQGYAAYLRVRILEKPYPTAAARLAEAFAKAVPNSAYSPQLLDTASRILSKSDPARSAELRRILKERYPEDPLSQDK